jgi:hypothetical protein
VRGGERGRLRVRLRHLGQLARRLLEAGEELRRLLRIRDPGEHRRPRRLRAVGLARGGLRGFVARRFEEQPLVELLDEGAHALARARVAGLAHDQVDQIVERHGAVEQHEHRHGLGRDRQRLGRDAARVDEDEQRAAALVRLLDLDGAQARVRRQGVRLRLRRCGRDRTAVRADEPAGLAAAGQDDLRVAHASALRTTRMPNSTASGSADSSGLKRPEWCGNVFEASG